MPPPHRLFLIQELLALICEHLQNDLGNYGGGALASLARTSKIFYDVATVALWSTLHGLSPLLESLASDLTFNGLGTVIPIQRPLMLQRPLKRAEWKILQRRASRIKHLHVNDPFRLVDVSIFRTLCNPPTTSPLFPHLRSVIWNDDRPETFPFIRTLSGPSVTSLVIKIAKDAHAWQATELGILTSLPYVCPNVTHVSFPTNAFVGDTSFISETLCLWPKLTEIKCGGINLSALVYLAKHPTLRKFSFTLPTIAKVWLDYLPSQAFFSVLDMEIHTTDTSDLVAFINKLEGSPTSLRMLMDVNPPPNVVDALFTALARFQLRDLTFRLTTQFRPFDLPNPPPFPYNPDQTPHPNHPYLMSQMAALLSASSSTFHVLTSRHFAPLTFLENLGKIDINVDHAICLSDADLKALISSWPRLHFFSLNDVTGWRIKSGITHVGLVAMLKHCPCLQTLCIALNTLAFKEVPPNRPGKGIENTSLQVLGLADSTIEPRETMAVAAFLSDIFPNLTDILAWDSVSMLQRPCAALYGERWEQVTEMVKGINNVRQQERTWKQLSNGD